MPAIAANGDHGVRADDGRYGGIRLQPARPSDVAGIGGIAA